MKIISWNVNSVRARINNILSYISQAKPDILLLQEIKTQDENFPYEDIKKKLIRSCIQPGSQAPCIDLYHLNAKFLKSKKYCGRNKQEKPLKSLLNHPVLSQ